MQQKWAFFNYLHGGINAIGYQTITTRTIYVYTNAQTTHEFPMWIITSIKQKGKRIFAIVGKTYIILQDIYNIHSLDHYTLYIQRNMILVNHILWQLSYEIAIYIWSFSLELCVQQMFAIFLTSMNIFFKKYCIFKLSSNIL